MKQTTKPRTAHVAALIVFASISIGLLICGYVFDAFNIISIAVYIGISIIVASLIIVTIQKKWLQRSLFCGYVLIVAFVCLSFASVYMTAQAHGMYKLNTGMTKMTEYNKLTPNESILPEDYHNRLIIYYRYDCKDCHDTYHEICEYLKEKNIEPLWVSTRSKQGKELMETYPPSEVPTGIVTWKNGDKNEYIIRSIAISDGEDDNGNKNPSKLDTNAMDDLIEMLKTKENPHE